MIAALVITALQLIQPCVYLMDVIGRKSFLVHLKEMNDKDIESLLTTMNTMTTVTANNENLSISVLNLTSSTCSNFPALVIPRAWSVNSKGLIFGCMETEVNGAKLGIDLGFDNTTITLTEVINQLNDRSPIATDKGFVHMGVSIYCLSYIQSLAAIYKGLYNRNLVILQDIAECESFINDYKDSFDPSSKSLLDFSNSLDKLIYNGLTPEEYDEFLSSVTSYFKNNEEAWKLWALYKIGLLDRNILEFVPNSEEIESKFKDKLVEGKDYYTWANEYKSSYMVSEINWEGLTAINLADPDLPPSDTVVNKDILIGLSLGAGSMFLLRLFIDFFSNKNKKSK
jgi:hypothetical protein